MGVCVKTWWRSLYLKHKTCFNFQWIEKGKTRTTSGLSDDDDHSCQMIRDKRETKKTFNFSLKCEHLKALCEKVIPIVIESVFGGLDLVGYFISFLFFSLYAISKITSITFSMLCNESQLESKTHWYASFITRAILNLSIYRDDLHSFNLSSNFWLWIWTWFAGFVDPF